MIQTIKGLIEKNERCNAILLKKAMLPRMEFQLWHIPSKKIDTHTCYYI